MIEFINKRSGLIFLVADERKDEYLAAGHMLAAEFFAKKPSEAKPTKKKVTAKRTTKKSEV